MVKNSVHKAGLRGNKVQYKGYKGIMHDWILECGCTTTLFPFKMGLWERWNCQKVKERNPLIDGRMRLLLLYYLK